MAESKSNTPSKIKTNEMAFLLFILLFSQVLNVKLLQTSPLYTHFHKAGKS